MKYVLYFFTLSLVFTAGMLVGNFYLPAHDTSLAAAVSVPGLDSTNPALFQTTEENAQEALSHLTQALEACPIVVGQEKENLFNRISLFLTLQNFEVKKAVYQAEIAKNIIGNRTTAQFSRAAQEYAAAKQQVQQQADILFPPTVEPEAAIPGTQITESETIAPETLPSSSTISTTTASH